MIGERPPMTVLGFERTFFDGLAGIDLADVIVEGDASIHSRTVRKRRRVVDR